MKTGATLILAWAIRSDHTKVAAALLNVGANPDVQDSEGRTPMHWAAGRGHTKDIAALLNAGANPNILDSEFLRPQDLL